MTLKIRYFASCVIFVASALASGRIQAAQDDQPSAAQAKERTLGPAGTAQHCESGGTPCRQRPDAVGPEKRYPERERPLRVGIGHRAPAKARQPGAACHFSHGPKRSKDDG